MCKQKLQKMLYTMYLVCFRGREKFVDVLVLTCVSVLVAVFNCTNSVSLSLSRLSSRPLLVAVSRYQTM